MIETTWTDACADKDVVHVGPHRELQGACTQVGTSVWKAAAVGAVIVIGVPHAVTGASANQPKQGAQPQPNPNQGG
jgi:hypothetical protein